MAQLAEHWASIPKVVGSIPTVAGHIFQARPVWIYTQSNTTNIMLSALAHRMLRGHVHLRITFVFVSNTCVSLGISKTSPEDHATLSAFHALRLRFTIGRCENPECRNMAEYHGIWRNITEYGGISRHFPGIYRNITISSDGSHAMRLFINMDV